MNRKNLPVSFFLFTAIALLFVGCLPTDSQLFSYSEKYDLFFPNLPQNVNQSICYKFALPLNVPIGTFSIKGQLKMAPGVTIPAGQLGTTLEVIRKGHDVFRKDGMLDYDSAGRFHASVALDQGANFGKNDVLKISFAPLNQSFSNVHEIFTATYKAHP